MSNFAIATLRSRKVNAEIKARQALAKVKPGLKGILAKAVKYAGFLWQKAVSFFNLDFSSIWDMMFESYMEIKQFDWNATDKELEKQIDKNNQKIVTAAAETLGELLPYGMFRLANFFIGKILGKFSRKGKQAQQGIKVPVLSARIGLALAEEGADELRSSMRSFLTRSGQAQINNMFINSVLTARKNNWLGQESITDNRVDGSIAAKIEEKIKKLPEFWQEPVEEFIESFEDALQEVGYVVSFEIDDHMAALKAAREEKQEERTIEITPAKGADPMIFSGPQDEVQQAITTTIATYERIEQSGLAIPGSWPLKPGANRPQLAITYRNTNRRTSGALTIPHYSGPRKPNLPTYETGPWQGEWVLKDGSHLRCYAISKPEALRVIRALGKYVPAIYKEGQPTARDINRKIKRQKVQPRVAEFYPNGPAPFPEWKAYFNFDA